METERPIEQAVSPTPPRWGKRFNLIAAIVLAIFCIVFHISIGFSIPTIPIVVIFWLYLLALVIIAEWAMLRLFRKGVPSLPFKLERWSGRPIVLGILIVFVMLVTIVREGALAPAFTYNVNWYRAHHNTQNDFTSNSNSTSMGQNGELRLAGRYVDCTSIICSPSSDLCDAFEREFNCDNHHPERPRTEPVASVTVNVQGDPAPFCYTPLSKSATYQFTADLNIHGSHLGSSVNHSMSINSTIDQSMNGLGSCFVFRGLLGHQMASIVARHINEFMSNH